jgi:NAD(P)-dependent dehydrogenase (short-subunit alcohol dehydrogenase family)
MASSWVLISGASTGIGRAVALEFAAQGIHVLAGVRSTAAAERLQSSAPKGGEVIPVYLDVTDNASIRSALAQAEGCAGTDGLRGVICNAGIVVPGPVEHISSAEWRRQFDVNFFGAIELTRLALPLLRRAVRAHGRNVPRLMLVSSIGGRIAQPFMAPYTSSKFALTALGDSLRLELRRQGIAVTVVEPGAVATDIWAKGETAGKEFSEDHPARILYSEELDGIVALAAKTAPKALSAERAAQPIVRAFLAKRAPARLLVGTDAKMMSMLKQLLPISMFDALLSKEFGIPEAPNTGVSSGA